MARPWQSVYLRRIKGGFGGALHGTTFGLGLLHGTTFGFGIGLGFGFGQLLAGQGGFGMRFLGLLLQPDDLITLAARCGQELPPCVTIVMANARISRLKTMPIATWILRSAFLRSTKSWVI